MATEFPFVSWLRDLVRDWTDLLSSAGISAQKAEETFADLARHYSEPLRHYHNLGHIRHVLDMVAEQGAGTDPAGTWAAWLHDVIYDARAHDNEERSAEYARQLMGRLGCPEVLADETARLILLTKSHDPDPGDETGKVLVDADLAILAADPAEYDRYAQAIRQEYAWVPEAEYRAGRSRVLEGLLSRPRIYHTEAMFARGEARARENLRRERDRLRGEG